MKKPRILIVENSIAITGALESILRSSSYLSNQYSFVFLLPKGSLGVSYVKGMGFDVCELPMMEIRKNIGSLIIYLPLLLINTFRLRRIIKAQEIDLVVNNDFYNLLPATYRFFWGKIHYVCYVRFLPSRFPVWLVKFWFGLHNRFAGRIIAVSNAVKRELPSSDKVEVIYNELPSAESIYVAPNEQIILYPANYIEGKGHEWALRAFARVADSHPSWKLRFVGGDMGLKKNSVYKQKLESFAVELGLESKVEWKGFVSDMKTEYEKAALVLNFSDSESFSMTCLEAMYYGRAILATRCGGPEELIEDEQTGFLVPIGGLNQMAARLDLLLGNEACRMEIGKNAFQSVREKFSVEHTTMRLQKVYSEYIRT